MMKQISDCFSDPRQEICFSRAVLLLQDVQRLVNCLGSCGQQLSRWPRMSELFHVPNFLILPASFFICWWWQCLSFQPDEVLSHLIKPASRENLENVSNKGWLSSSSSEKVCTRIRKLAWGLAITREPETSELISRVITYWPLSMCRHCPFMWTGRMVVPVGARPLMEMLNLHNHTIQENQALF